ncbi:type IV pilus modification protein PilV [Pseudomonas turukhanskensis]|uniref:Type IV pilin Tt1218-like domain-containing protein n=1 Tax=Pseudomonas turukhanskensis TaxID=1806536 RepID=A0A9W6K9Q5_9PSED|nr:type IV pilus modification protein PilV [Pseudomonas turukhanskensis]GLK90723.1 hypothetical protein GCM10017655_37870 [Pseudomonas turukhanskensis]
MKTLNLHQKGTTLIEVLVAMIVLAIGILGIAAMQTTSVKANQSAYYRSQATLLAADITDRMRANRVVALAGSYDITTAPTSSTANEVDGDQAAIDKAQWLNQLATSLPEGTGSITHDNNNVFTVTIVWNDGRGRIRSTEVTDSEDADNTVNFTYRARL